MVSVPVTWYLPLVTYLFSFCPRLPTFAFPKFIAMAVTRLKRKNRKDKAKSAVRRQTLKIQNFKPVIKNVDIEEVKKEFEGKKK
jgi:hypothetical protein